MNDLLFSFCAKYPRNAIIAEKWEAATNSSFSFESLTKQRLAAFVDYMCNNMARSSARQYAAKLKAVLELHTDSVDLPTGWRKLLSIRDDESQHIYLTEDEIRRIIDYKSDTLTEEAVRQQFIIGCLTGARHSDYSNFTLANINSVGNLIYVSQKTHIKAELPLSPIVRDILFSDYSQYPGAYKSRLSDPTFNDTIRKICNLCDIDEEIQLYRRGKFSILKKWQAVSSHTSRRSFATNLYLRCRDLLLVSKLCGHASTTQTERYICCSMESMTDNAMAYFNAFG